MDITVSEIDGCIEEKRIDEYSEDELSALFSRAAKANRLVQIKRDGTVGLPKPKVARSSRAGIASQAIEISNDSRRQARKTNAQKAPKTPVSAVLVATKVATAGGTPVPHPFDRAAVMRDAHKQYRQMKALGWSWSRALSFAWARAKAGARQ